MPTPPTKNMHTPENIKLSNPSAGAPQKPFPFLQLPPELRKRVYGYAAASRIIRNRQRPTRLVRQTKDDKPNRESYIGLNSVCRQIRSEFRPMYMRRAKFVIDFKDLDSFVAAFFSKMKVGMVFPAKVTVMLGNNDGDKPCDLLVFLKARGLARVVKWKFEQYNYPYSWGHRNMAKQVCELFNMAAGLSIRRLFKDVNSGLLTKIEYGISMKSNEYFVWGYCRCHVVLKKKGGRLDEHEKTYLQQWAGQMMPGIVVEVKVVDLKDALVEEYQWSADKAELALVPEVVETEAVPSVPTEELNPIAMASPKPSRLLDKIRGVFCFSDADYGE
jgi:hypothetical protein